MILIGVVLIMQDSTSKTSTKSSTISHRAKLKCQNQHLGFLRIPPAELAELGVRMGMFRVGLGKVGIADLGRSFGRDTRYLEALGREL